jgi:hypothetical protein
MPLEMLPPHSNHKSRHKKTKTSEWLRGMTLDYGTQNHIGLDFFDLDVGCKRIGANEGIK